MILPLYDADSCSYGGTINFDKIIDRTGSLTISNTKIAVLAVIQLTMNMRIHSLAVMER